jgi:hypothetical protein
MQISVILPFRGNTQILAWALEGYARQQLPPELRAEVLVGADDSPLPPLPANTGTITFLVYSFPRCGAAAVRNRLIERSQGDILVFGNADCRPDPLFLQTHAHRLASLPQNSLVLGNSPWESPATRSQPVTVFDDLLSRTPMIFFFDRLVPHQWYDFRHAWTLNLSVRRADAVKAGGFHDLLRPVYFEDLAFAHRLLGPEKNGVFYEPDARVTHRHPATWDQYLDREELLGLMTPVLARVAPEVFSALHNHAPLDRLSADYDVWTRLDASMHQWIYSRMNFWAAQPAAALDPLPPPARQAFLESLYQMHIPLKRLAFRLGFLRGLALVDDALWQQRIPTGLWRRIAVPSAALPQS